MRDLFTEADRVRIAEAVRAAETRTRGEIVTAVVPASDDYSGAAWQAGALGALAGPIALALADWAGGWWGTPSAWPMILAGAAGCLAGYLLVRSSGTLTRLFASDEEIELRVQRRARQAFLEHEVFATRERSGILIFLSLLEHRVVVLGDSGIDAVAEPGTWEGVVADLTRGIREGRPADALIQAVERCGDLLDRAGLAPREDDRNELPDALRLDGGPDVEEMR